jgi:site-specific DNA-cytosine methylase
MWLVLPRLIFIFSGAGGLSEGMSKTGFFETKWAIEQSASAALTFA